MDPDPQPTKQRRFRRQQLLFVGLTFLTLFAGTSVGVRSVYFATCWHILALGILLAWALGHLRSGLALPRTPIDFPLLAFILSVSASLALSSSPRLSLDPTLRLLFLACGFYVVVDLLLRDWSAQTFAVAVLMTGSVVILVGLLELILWVRALMGHLWGFENWRLLVIFLSANRERITLGHANHLALFFAMTIPLALSSFRTFRSRSSKAGLILWLCGASVVLISSFSRGGMFGTVLGLLALLTLGGLSRLRVVGRQVVKPLGNLRSKAALLAVPLVAIIVALAALATWLAHVRTANLMGRVRLWRAALLILLDRPLFGAGPGTFGRVLPTVPTQTNEYADLFLEHAHNIFANFAAEEGLVGLLAFVALVIATGIAFVRAWGKQGWPTTQATTPQDRGILSGMAAGLVGLLGWSLFEVPRAAPFSGIYAVIFVAALISPLASPPKRSRRSFWLLFILTILALSTLLARIDLAHYFQWRAWESAQVGDLTSAVESLDTAVSLDPHFTPYSLQRGVASALLASRNGDQGRLQVAIRDFETAISHGDDFAHINFQLGWLAWEAGRYEDALRHLRRATEQAPANPYYHLGLGYALSRGDTSSAEEEYALAIALSPQLTRSAFWRTTPYGPVGESDLLPHALAAARALPEEAFGQPRLRMAQLAYYADDLASATLFLEASEPSAEYYLLRAKIAMGKENWDMALMDLEAALGLNPTLGAAYFERGQLYARLGRSDFARRDLRIASALGTVAADVALGEQAYRMGDLRQALLLLESLAPPCPSKPPCHLYATNIWRRPSLEADFTPEVIRCAPRDDFLLDYLRLASAHLQVGDASMAGEICQWLRSYYEPSYIQQWAPGELAGSPCEETGDAMPNY